MFSNCLKFLPLTSTYKLSLLSNCLKVLNKTFLSIAAHASRTNISTNKNQMSYQVKELATQLNPRAQSIYQDIFVEEVPCYMCKMWSCAIKLYPRNLTSHVSIKKIRFNKVAIYNSPANVNTPTMLMINLSVSVRVKI